MRSQLEPGRQLNQPPDIGIGEHRRTSAAEVRIFRNYEILRLRKVVGMDAFRIRPDQQPVPAELARKTMVLVDA